MTNKKVPVHLVFTSIYFVLAVVTLIPMASASKASLLGYQALCSFTPISTFMLLVVGGLHIFLHQRNLAKSA